MPDVKGEHGETRLTERAWAVDFDRCIAGTEFATIQEVSC